MSIQSDAAKKHIEKLFQQAYPNNPEMWIGEHPFAKLDMKRGWRFDYADFAHRCAIEIDGGTFQVKRTRHASGTGLRAWREKNNAAMAAGWRVWHYSPEEIVKLQIRTGRKTLLDMPPVITPVLTCLPWLVKRETQSTIEEMAEAHNAWCSCGIVRFASPAKLSGVVSTIPLSRKNHSLRKPDSAQGACSRRELKEEL